jgi:hypothetical protein
MKMKLQGSDARSIKTLQSQNSPQRRIRFWLSRLATLHGRLTDGSKIEIQLASYRRLAEVSLDGETIEYIKRRIVELKRKLLKIKG